MMKKIITTIKGWFKRPSLRDRCIEAYGSKFGEIYDNIGSGIPVGGFTETAIYLSMITEIKEKWNL